MKNLSLAHSFSFAFATLREKFGAILWASIVYGVIVGIFTACISAGGYLLLGAVAALRGIQPANYTVVIGQFNGMGMWLISSLGALILIRYKLGYTKLFLDLKDGRSFDGSKLESLSKGFSLFAWVLAFAYVQFNELITKLLVNTFIDLPHLNQAGTYLKLTLDADRLSASILSLAALVLLVVLATRFLFFLQTLVDKKMGVIQSLKANWLLTSGHTLRLLVFMLTWLALMVASSLLPVLVVNAKIGFWTMWIVNLPVIALQVIFFLASFDLYRQLMPKE